jgi:hypothetical protein
MAGRSKLRDSAAVARGRGAAPTAAGRRGGLVRVTVAAAPAATVTGSGPGGPGGQCGDRDCLSRRPRCRRPGNHCQVVPRQQRRGSGRSAAAAAAAASAAAVTRAMSKHVTCQSRVTGPSPAESP